MITALSAQSDITNCIGTLAAKIALDDISYIPVEKYTELMKKINKPIKKKESFLEQIKNRGDLMIIPDPNISGMNGCIAWVRQIWQVSVADIAIRTSETRNRPGERIARLDSPFRYRITQLMSQVFADIGLPDIPHTIDNELTKVFVNG